MSTKILFFLALFFLVKESVQAQEASSAYEVQKKLTKDCIFSYQFFHQNSDWATTFTLHNSQLEKMKEELEEVKLLTAYPAIQESLERLKASAIAGGTGYFFAQLHSRIQNIKSLIRGPYIAAVIIIEAILGYAFKKWEQLREEKPNATEFPGLLSAAETEKLLTDLSQSILKEEESCEDKSWPPQIVNEQYVNLFSLLARSPNLE